MLTVTVTIKRHSATRYEVFGFDGADRYVFGSQTKTSQDSAYDYANYLMDRSGATELVELN